MISKNLEPSPSKIEASLDLVFGRFRDCCQSKYSAETEIDEKGRKDIESKIEEAISIVVGGLRFQTKEKRKSLSNNLREECRNQAFYVATLEKELRNVRSKKYRIKLANEIHRLAPKLYSLPLDGPLSASGIGVNVRFLGEQDHPPGNFPMGIAMVTAANLCFLAWYIEEAEKQNKVRTPPGPIFGEMVANFATVLDRLFRENGIVQGRWEPISELLVATFSLEERKEESQKRREERAKKKLKSNKKQDDDTALFSGQWARKLVAAQKNKWKTRKHFPWHPEFPLISELLGKISGASKK